MMKSIINRKLQIIFCLWALILFPSGCRSVKNISPFQSNEYIDIEFLDNDLFKYSYYQFIDFNTFNYEYCNGVFYTLDSNIKVLVPVYFDNKNLDAYLMEDVIKKQNKKLRIKIETNLKCNKDKFKTRLYLDSTEIYFKGTEIDTLLDYNCPSYIKAEIVMSEEIFEGKPTPSFQSISTKKNYIKDSTSNFLYLKIPVKYNMFYYKNIDKIRAKDLGDDYLLIDSGKKIKKGKSQIDCN